MRKTEKLTCNTFTKSDRAKISAVFDLISDALPFGRLWYSEPDGISKRNWLREISQSVT
jgi:hypothetical protein